MNCVLRVGAGRVTATAAALLLLLAGVWSAPAASAQEVNCEELTYNERVAAGCLDDDSGDDDRGDRGSRLGVDGDDDSTTNADGDADDGDDGDGGAVFGSDDDSSDADADSGDGSDDPDDGDEAAVAFDGTPDPEPDNAPLIAALIGCGVIGSALFMGARRNSRHDRI